MNKRVKSLLSIVLCITLVLSNIAFADTTSAQPTKYADIVGNAYETQIREWISNGFIKGYPDGNFKPQNQITRSEFMALVNRAYAFKDAMEIKYSDVNKKDWYYKDAAIATKAGFMQGSGGKLLPLDNISRQEMAVILSRLTKNEKAVADDAIINNFADKSDIPTWSKSAISVAMKNKFFDGFVDKAFKPIEKVTRLEAVVALDRAFRSMYKGIYASKGTFGPETGMTTLDGDVVVIAPDVTLRNTTINGNLILRETIGEGNVYLEGVVVKGETIVKGGGANSIVIKNSTIGKVTVIKEGNTVRIVASGSTTIDTVNIGANVKLEEYQLTGTGFKDVLVLDDIPKGTNVVFIGNFGNIQIDSANINVAVQSGTIDTLTLAKKAVNTNINLGQQATVTTMTLDAATNVTGTGAIGTANVNATGTIIEQKPTKVVMAPQVIAQIAGAPVTEPQTQVPSIGGGGGGGTPPANSAPVATNVTITGDAVVGRVLTGNYTYSDAENNGESGSTFNWYRASSINEVKRAIPSAKNKTYTVQAEDEGMYLFFEVTPIATTGTKKGNAVLSAVSNKVIVVYEEITGDAAKQYVETQDFGYWADATPTNPAFNVGFKINLDKLKYQDIEKIEVSLVDESGRELAKRTATGAQIQTLKADDETYGGLDGQLSAAFIKRTAAATNDWWNSTAYDFTPPAKAVVRITSNYKVYTVETGAPTGTPKFISTVSELSEAILNQADGQTWYIKDGVYNHGRFDSINKGGQTGWYFPITANNITIMGESKEGTVITSDVQSANGTWASQDHISVWGDNVTIKNLTVKPKIETNKAIEVMGKNFTLSNVDFVQRDEQDYNFAGSLYFNPQNITKDIGNALVENVILNDAWISCSTTAVTAGTLALKDTTIDFRGSAYADNASYGVISKNPLISVAVGSSFTILVDNTLASLQTQVLDRVPAGTTVILSAGTYYNSTGTVPTAPAGVTLVPAGATFVKADKIISNITELKAAIASQADNQTWVIKEGTYDVPKDTTTLRDNNGQIVLSGGQSGWYMPITANNLTVIGVGNPVITSSTVTPNGSWASQNFITVWGDNVTLKGLKITPKVEENKSIEVVGDKQFTIEGCTFMPNTIAAGADATYAGSLYFNGAGTKGTKAILVKNNIFNNALVAFDGVEGSDITVAGNTFENITDGGYAIGNTYWGSAERKTTQYANVKVNGNSFNNVSDTTKIIAARLNQTFTLDAANKINGSAINKNDFGKYINFNNLAYWIECKNNMVIVDGVTYVSPYKNISAYVTNSAQLKAAVDTAKAGDTILVAAGEYNESIEITKPIKLIGAGADKTILNAKNDTSWYVISLGRAGVYGDDLSGTVIEGFTINAPKADTGDKAPIYLTAHGSDNNKIIIRNNVFVGQPRAAAQQGIGILTPYDLNIGNVEVTNNKFNTLKYGMYFNSIRDALISGNTIDDTKYAGMVIAADNKSYICRNVAITGNTLTNISWQPKAVYSNPMYDSGICVGANAESITISDNSITMLNEKLLAFDSAEAAVVSNEVELKAALDNEIIKTIYIIDDITIAKKILISRSVTINGEGKTITITADLGVDNSSKHALGIEANNVTIKNLTINSASKAYGVQAYVAENITLDNITITNSKGAGLTVNGSSVIAYNLNTNNNTWGSVNVDPGSGVKTASVFTLNGGLLAENIQIWSDGAYVGGTATVTVNAEGYNMFRTAAAFIWTNKALTNGITITKNGMTTLYPTIQAAVTAAQSGDTIDVAAGDYTITDTINVNKEITIRGADGFATKITTTAGKPVFTLSAAATLDGIFINKVDKTDQHLVTITANNATVTNSKFTGQYVQGDGEVARAIVPNAGITGYLISNNHFESLRQPAYLEGSGTVANNLVKNTRGWVVCVNHKVTFTDNTFEGNAVDIAIIANNQTSSENYSDVIAISSANNGAFVENQLSGVSAKNGALYNTISIYNGSITTYFKTIQAAITAAQPEDTILVADGTYKLAEQLKINKPLTIIGSGTVIITPAIGFNEGTYSADKHLISINGVIGLVHLENLVISNAKRTGLNVFESTNVVLKDITSKANVAAGLVVNNSIVVADNLNTSENGWGYGVNVDNGSNPSAGAPATSFTLNSGTISEGKQIVSDKGGVEIIAPNYQVFINDASKVFGATITSWYAIDGENYLDTSVNFNFNNIKVTDIDSVKFSLYQDKTLLGTAVSTGANLVTLLKDCAQYWGKTADTYTEVTGIRTMSSAFKNRTEENNNTYWVRSACTATNESVPNHLVIEVVVDNVTYITIK